MRRYETAGYVQPGGRIAYCTDCGLVVADETAHDFFHLRADPWRDGVAVSGEQVRRILAEADYAVARIEERNRERAAGNRADQ